MILHINNESFSCAVQAKNHCYTENDLAKVAVPHILKGIQFNKKFRHGAKYYHSSIQTSICTRFKFSDFCFKYSHKKIKPLYIEKFYALLEPKTFFQLYYLFMDLYLFESRNRFHFLAKNLCVFFFFNLPTF